MMFISIPLEEGTIIRVPKPDSIWDKAHKKTKIEINTYKGYLSSLIKAKFIIRRNNDRIITQELALFASKYHK